MLPRLLPASVTAAVRLYVTPRSARSVDETICRPASLRSKHTVMSNDAAHQ